MKTRKEDGLLVLFWTLLAFVPMMLYRGWLLTFIWAWFITVAFGLPVPSVWVLAGLLLVVSYVKGAGESADKTEYTGAEFIGRTITSGIVYPSVGFGMCWVIAFLGGLL